MTYYVEKAIEDFGGKDKLLKVINSKGFNQVELHKLLRLSNSDKRINAGVYKRIYKYLNIDGLPYGTLTPADKTFQLQLDKFMPEYWNSPYILEELHRRLLRPTLNIAENRLRLVISFPRHPKANVTSRQIKAHIVAWEIYNEQYVPYNYWVVPKDNDYLNLEESNLILINTTEYKSKRFSGDGNPAFLHGESKRPKLGGWFKISANYRIYHNKCGICSNSEDLVVHHIINYRLFPDPLDAHQELNLMTLCTHCHPKVHSHKLSIKETLIAEMRYSKLLELLETLKSQVPDTMMATYIDVEKQLGLTDNQQPNI